ncbi:MAG: nicotinate-nucleotide adenylyltransferase [Blastocatellia bacterium]|jgi:nicotinate-nucleotide adenylyltransferase|nr:nicotinate-nucleotide adenylyltransferase [Blastocatellia bacterium]
MMPLPRVAIYGGTFDPVHTGHIEVARNVLELFDLEEVLFVPACEPPHKSAISSAFHRFAMLALATQQDVRLRISTIELDEPERPYAVDTVERMQGVLGAERHLFFMIGADSWSEITTWHEWQRLLRMCDLIVVTRPGYDLSGSIANVSAQVVDVRGATRREVSEALAGGDGGKGPRVFLTGAAMVDISATEIRAAARAGEGAQLRAMVPMAVASYIERYELYKN